MKMYEFCIILPTAKGVRSSHSSTGSMKYSPRKHPSMNGSAFPIVMWALALSRTLDTNSGAKVANAVRSSSGTTSNVQYFHLRFMRNDSLTHA